MSNAKTQVMEMLALQDGANSAINPNWKTAANPWHRAEWAECAECIDDHLAGGWKWWKKPHVDLEQAQIEMIDCWHFLMSSLIETYEPRHGMDGLANYILLNLNPEFVSGRVPRFDSSKIVKAVEAVERYAAKAASKEGRLTQFSDACEALGLTLDSLYRIYLGKNAINRVRAANGYKTGEYIKAWGEDGSEDNVFMESILKDVPSTGGFEWLMQTLQARYEEVKRERV